MNGECAITINIIIQRKACAIHCNRIGARRCQCNAAAQTKTPSDTKPPLFSVIALLFTETLLSINDPLLIHAHRRTTQTCTIIQGQGTAI